MGPEDRETRRERGQRRACVVLGAVTLALGMSGPEAARAEESVVPTDVACASDAPTGSVHPESARLAELETLRLRERHHFAHRRVFAYSVLGGGVVFTAGLALLARNLCVYECPSNASALERAAGGIVIGGLAVMLVSSLAVVLHTATLRDVRRRIVHLSVAPTASRRAGGAQLTLTW